MKYIPDNYQPAPDLLKDRIILVTGAGSGIGATAAYSFAAHGATVLLLGKTVRKLEHLYDVIEKDGHPKPAIIPLNLETASTQDYDTFAAMIAEEFGRLDGLLHNAAILGSLTPVEHYGIAHWNKVMQINLTAPFLLTRACIPLLKKSADASIIFTSDEVGRKGRAYWGAYGASKFATEGLMQILADELGDTTSIRVNSLDPGPLLTRLRKKAYPGEDNAHLPLPETVMNDYLFLMGGDSRGICGQPFSARRTQP